MFSDLHIGLAGLGGGSKHTKIKMVAVNAYVGPEPLFARPDTHRQFVCPVSFLMDCVGLVDSLCYYPKVFALVIKTISVDMVYL